MNTKTSLNVSHRVVSPAGIAERTASLKFKLTLYHIHGLGLGCQQFMAEAPATTSLTACAFYLFIRAHRNLISSPVCRHHPCMISSFVRALVFAFKARRELALENVALRQQLAVVIRKKRRSRTAGSTFCGAQVGLGSGSCCRLLGCDDVVLCRCLRCLLLVMCTHPSAKKALTLHLARSESHERYFGCNLMHHKALASSHQHLMAEAPAEVGRQEQSRIEAGRPQCSSRQRLVRRSHSVKTELQIETRQRSYARDCSSCDGFPHSFSPTRRNVHDRSPTSSR